MTTKKHVKEYIPRELRKYTPKKVEDVVSRHLSHFQYNGYAPVEEDIFIQSFSTKEDAILTIEIVLEQLSMVHGNLGDRFRDQRLCWQRLLASVKAYNKKK